MTLSVTSGSLIWNVLCITWLFCASYTKFRFITSNETTLLRQFSHAKVNRLIISALIIINIFITYGDIILQTTNKYDELYYELIRLKSIFLQVAAYTKKVDKNQVKSNPKKRLKVGFSPIRRVAGNSTRFSTISPQLSTIIRQSLLRIMASTKPKF